MLSVCAIFMATAAIAQSGSAPAAAQAAPAPKMWYCPKCFMASKTRGYCPKDHTHFVPEGYYYCSNCGAFNSAGGDCPKCGNKMQFMSGTATQTQTPAPTQTQH